MYLYILEQQADNDLEEYDTEMQDHEASDKETVPAKVEDEMETQDDSDAERNDEPLGETPGGTMVLR